MSNSLEIEKGLRKATEIIDARVLRAMQETAEMIVANTSVLVWTHNLWDSIGCGIYKDGVLRSYVAPPTVATQPRSGNDEFPVEARSLKNSERPIWNVDGIDTDRAYWGTVELFEMLERPPSEILSMKGWAIYYVSAQPYSEIVNDNFEIEAQRIYPYVISKLKSYASN